MNRPIYLDNNAGTRPHPRAIEAMFPYLQEQFHNPSSPYRSGAVARAALEGARARSAEALGAEPYELYFCSGGTEAINWALRGAARSAPAGRRTIVISDIEHPAVRSTAAQLTEEGFRIIRIPVDTDGVLRLDPAEAAIGPDTAIVSVMHANNETGVIQPIEAISAMAEREGALFHVDAVQTAGKIPLALSTLSANLVSISGHKLHGPRGAGILYVKRGTTIAPLITGGGQERGGRSGTENVAAAVGLAEALSIAKEETEDAQPRTAALRDRLEKAVCSALNRVTVNGRSAPRLPNTSSLSIFGVDSESTVLGMDIAGIQIAAGSACSTDNEGPSPVLLAMGRTPQEAGSTVRISLSRYTDIEEIDTAAEKLISTVTRLRTVSGMTE